MSHNTHEFRAETRKVLNILTHSLYTNREIFLRELLSNSSDALDKLRYAQSAGEKMLEPDLPLEIRIDILKDDGILTVSDTGIGMTEQEMVENLGTIAKSGSEQFLNDIGQAPKFSPDEITEEDEDEEEIIEAEDKAEDPKNASIIGRFGIGFYSVFMVADKVEVISKPAKLPAQPAKKWVSDGLGTFTIEEVPADEDVKRGTTIRLHLKENAKEFLEKYRVESIIRGHSNFLPFPIYLEGEVVNTTPALWREPKFSITKEQYNEFYKFLTYDQNPPQDVIHLAVDAPVQFNALIFIPDSSNDYFNEQRDQWGLDLYARRVLIQRNNQELIPNYLAFLKGVVDTEDLPLNISRETLQENIVVRKIGQTIVKQVLSFIERMAASDKEKYNKFWQMHGRYFKFGFNDYAVRDRIAPLLRFASSHTEAHPEEGDITSFDDYLSRAKSGQQEIWYVSAPTKEAARVNPHLERFRRKGIEVLYLLEAVDEFALETLGTYKNHTFKAVEQADNEALKDFADSAEAAPTAPPLSETDEKSFDDLLAAMKTILGDSVKDIRVSTRLMGSPACLVSPDGVTSSMEKLIRVMQKNDSVPQKVLELNRDHSFSRALLRIFKANPDDPIIPEMVRALLDSTLLLDGYMNEPFTMADRTLKLLEQASNWYADLRKL